MIRKYMIMILLVLTFLTTASFAQWGFAPPNNEREGDFTTEQRIAGTVEMKKVANMFRMQDRRWGYIWGYTIEQMNTMILEGHSDQNYTVVKNDQFGLNKVIYNYTFDGGETLEVCYFGVLASYASSKDGINLLNLEYTAETVDFPVSINGMEVITLNPIVTIRKKIYVPIVDFSDQLGIKVDWDKERQQKESELAAKLYAPLKEAFSKLRKGMTRDEVKGVLGEQISYTSGRGYVYSFEGGEELILWFHDAEKLSAAFNKDYCDLFSGEYVARTISFPVFINDNELIISNSIVTINNQIYISLDNLAEWLGIKFSFNEKSSS